MATGRREDNEESRRNVLEREVDCKSHEGDEISGG